MVTPEILETCLKELAGCGPPWLMVKDSNEFGWRVWTPEDTKAICSRLNSFGPSSGGSPNVACYNAKEAARAMGVSISTLKELLRRKENPIPHIRNGRMIMIPVKALERWLLEECRRNEGRPWGNT